MSQNFNTLLGSSIIKNDRETINENFDAVRSCYSGTTAPTDNLIAGMMWFDTSTSKLYQLKSNLTTWMQLADLSSSIAIVPKASNADTATNATNDENGNAISGYVANIEQDSSDESVFNVYDGNGSLVTTIVIPKVEIDVMTGASASAGGVAGLVPAPSAGDQDKFLAGDGTFKEAGKVTSVNGNVGDVIVDLPVGHLYWSVEPTVPTGRVPALGALYNRALYADLWDYALERDLVKSESEWQAIASANDGNCAYYSSGDGSSTFRVPSIKCWVKGANSASEVGSCLQAGLPNIKGKLQMVSDIGSVYDTGIANGAFKKDLSSGHAVFAANSSTAVKSRAVLFNASNYSSVYRDDVYTVQPPSIVGMWLIVAFGVAHNVGEADVADVMSAVETAQTSVQTIDDKISGITDYIVESYRNGTEWYEVYKSGKVRQGGVSGNTSGGAVTITFHKAFANLDYTAIGFPFESTVQNNWFNFGSYSRKNTSIYMVYNGDATSATRITWIAEGQGA